METEEKSRAKLDHAISEYFDAAGDQGSIVTGWIITASVQHPTMANSDGYFTQNSEGLPFHSQIGLLSAALDEKKNMILINMWKGEEN
jgi:hypothetical protein